MNPLYLIPTAWLMMLVTNNDYFFEFNYDFSDKYKKGETIVYNSIWLGVYQLFRSLYFFTLIGLSAWNIRTFPNIFLILFLTEYFRHLVRHRYWFLTVNLTSLFYLLYYIFKIKLAIY